MHTDLLVYKKSQELVQMIYLFLDTLPRKEFDLISQMKKSAISIPSNIAEGAGRNSREQLLYFLNISLASLCELEAQYQICINTGLSKKEPKLNDIMDHVKRLLIRTINSLKKKSNKPTNRFTDSLIHLFTDSLLNCLTDFVCIRKNFYLCNPIVRWCNWQHV